LYGKIEKVVSSLLQENKKCITIVVDDLSLMEAAANGSSNYVLDFLHYCHTLTSAFVRLRQLFNSFFFCSSSSSFHTSVYFIESSTFS
jgi:hypothetical protein